MADPTNRGGTLGRARSARDARQRRVLWTSLGISAALHLLVVLIYPWLGRPDPGGVVLPGPVDADGGTAGTRLVLIDAVGESEIDNPDAPETIQELERPEAPSLEGDPLRGGQPGAGIVAPGRRGRSAAELLRPQAEDSLIWRRVDPELTELSDQERAELRMRWAITEWNEAEASAERAAAEALDWTHTDENGNKWGVSPGKLHLGGLTLPLPVGFGAPPGRSESIDQRVQEFEAAERQAGRARVWETWEERAQAIRRRKDREREEARAQRPDTTRSR